MDGWTDGRKDGPMDVGKHVDRSKGGKEQSRLEQFYSRRKTKGASFIRAETNIEDAFRAETNIKDALSQWNGKELSPEEG